jgi:chromosome segregation ATPase
MLTRLIMAILAVAAMLSAAVVLAESKSGGASANSSGPSPTQQQLVADQKAVGEAKVQLGKAQTDLTLVVGKLRAAFETSPDFVAALEAVKQALAVYDAAKDKVREALKASSPDYAAAVKVRDDAKAQQEQLKGDADASAQQRSDAASAFMQADSAVNKVETEAFDADQPTKDAKAAYEAALAKLNEMRKTFEQSLPQNGDFTTAKSAVDTEQKAVTAAEAKVAADIKADQKARTDAKAAEDAAAKAKADAEAKAHQRHPSTTNRTGG